MIEFATLMPVLVLVIVAVPYCYVLALVACTAYFEAKRRYHHVILNDLKEE